MILADVNVLIYAFRSDLPRHAICKSWLDGIVAADALFGLSPAVLAAVIRVTSNPRIFREPSPVEEALAYCDNLLAQPNREIIEPGERHWPIFRRLCHEAGARGAHIADAWFAALAIERACTWITYDRDFARFRELDWREPAS